jgi:hypothetical protein
MVKAFAGSALPLGSMAAPAVLLVAVSLTTLATGCSPSIHTIIKEQGLHKACWKTTDWDHKEEPDEAMVILRRAARRQLDIRVGVHMLSNQQIKAFLARQGIATPKKGDLQLLVFRLELGRRRPGIPKAEVTLNHLSLGKVDEDRRTSPRWRALLGSSLMPLKGLHTFKLLTGRDLPSGSSVSLFGALFIDFPVWVLTGTAVDPKTRGHGSSTSGATGFHEALKDSQKLAHALSQDCKATQNRPCLILRAVIPREKSDRKGWSLAPVDRIVLDLNYSTIQTGYDACSMNDRVVLKVPRSGPLARRINALFADGTRPLADLAP